MRRLAFLTLSLVGAFMVAGCSADSGSDDCDSVGDCLTGQICRSGECVDDACVSDDECGGDYVCQRGACTLSGDTDAGTDASTDPVDDTPMSDTTDDGGEDTADTNDVSDDTADDTSDDTDAVDDTADTGMDTEDIDYGPLMIVSQYPEANATRVPLDVVITVTFNQPMNALRFIPSNVELIDSDGMNVPTDINYDDATYTLEVTLTGGTQLAPATPYTFRLDRLIAAASGDTLDESLRVPFVTVGPAGGAFHEQLAQEYAPIIYQEAENLAQDTFTAIDFDGDLDPTNNLENSGALNPGFVYYTVIETRTHFHILYWVYYPGIRFGSGATNEHDSLGISVIVEKVDGAELGELRAFTTFYQSAFLGWAPDASFFAPGEAPSGVEDTLANAYLEDGSHIAVYVQPGRHTICLPNASTASGPCSPGTGDSAPFEDGTRGIVWRTGDVPMAAGDAADDAHTYVLVPFIEKIWALRNRTSGDDAVFNGTLTYDPPVPDRPGDGVRFPSSLESDDFDARGELPFAYRGDGGATQGVWIVDPAYAADLVIDFAEDYSLDYCFHPYLDIDTRDTVADCTAP